MEAPQPDHGVLYGSPIPPPMHSSPMPRPPGPAPMYGPSSLEFKIQELNQRLRDRPEMPGRWWWDNFALEFFDDTATILISFYSPAEGEKHFTIGRTMIPQYFSSIFEGGATEMYYTFTYPRQYMSHSGPTLECDNVLTTTQYLQPSYARVLVDSRISFQCSFDERSRITNWTQFLLRHKEYVPREMISLSLQESGSVDALLSNFTHLGLNSCTLNFLNVSAISDSIRPDVKVAAVGYGMHGNHANDFGRGWPPNENEQAVPLCMMAHPAPAQPGYQPMVEFSQSPVLSANTDSASNERFCLSESPKPAKKPKRSRKGANSKDSTTASIKKVSKNCPINNIAPPVSCAPLVQQPTLPLSHQDVMVVGEPVMMGGDLDDKDERRITRLENNGSDFLISSHNHGMSQSQAAGINGIQAVPLDLNIAESYNNHPIITAALDALE